jgi:hypothetical protein
VNSEAETTGGETRASFLKQKARLIERLRIIEAAETESVSEAARRFRCYRTTVYKLLARYLEGGQGEPDSNQTSVAATPNSTPRLPAHAPHGPGPANGHPPAVAPVPRR